MIAGSKNTSVPLLREFGVDEFEHLIRNAERPVLAAFLATWSRPCQLISPIVRHLQVSYQGRIEVVAVDADSHPELGVCYEVESIPTLLYFFNGQMLGRRVGLASKQAIVSELEQLLGRLPSVVASTNPPSPAGQPLGQKQPKS